MVEFRSFQVAPDCAWGTSAVAQELYARAQDLPALKDEEETRIWRLEHPSHGHLFLKEYRLPRRRRWFASRTHPPASTTAHPSSAPSNWCSGAAVWWCCSRWWAAC